MTIIGDASARVGLIRAPAAELPEMGAAFVRRFVESRGIEASRSLEAVVCVSQSSADTAAMRRAAEAAVGDARAVCVRRWFAERGPRNDFEEVRELRADYNDWASRNDAPALSDKMFSSILSLLGFEHRLHRSTRRSEFWLRTSLVEAGE